MTSDEYSIGERLFRAAAMAFVGAVAGFILGLILVRRPWFDANPFPEFPLAGALLGGVLGFWLTDYAWKRVLRTILPFGNWP